MAEWNGKTRGGSFGYGFFIFLIKHLGLNAAYAFLFVVVPYFVPFAPKATAASWKYWRKIHNKSVLCTIGKIFQKQTAAGGHTQRQGKNQQQSGKFLHK